jgi:serine/threonine protein kinase
MVERRERGDIESAFDDELLDDFAATSVSIDARAALAVGPDWGARPGQVRVGDVLAGRYRVERIHKRGALGLSLEALHTQLGQRVAVRLSAADPRAYPEAAARFLRGARLAVQFQNDHTARILDVGTLESGAPYVVAEFLSGSDVQKVLRVRECLGVPEAVDYVLQACEALSEAHAHGVVHRNLKPSNLFLTRREGARRLIVLDFGISDDPLSDAAINLGGISSATQALAYLAPEQVRDPNSVDARADIWALGAILHEMLTGSAPFDSHTTPGLLAMIAADPPVPVSHLRPEVPAELESAVACCLAKERDQRYPGIAALAIALQPFASATGQVSAERVSGIASRSSRSRRPPPLPGHAVRAIVHVPQPPRPTPPVVLAASPSRRLGELALTGLGLAAAGALGVYVAIHAMEGALAAAARPQAVVASLSPALAAPPTALSPVVSAAVAPLVAVAPVKPQQAQPVVARAAVPLRRVPSKSATPERAVVADANPVASKSAQPQGLFDESN